MGLNPLPVSVQAECQKAAKLLSAFLDPVKGADQVIPSHVLRRAKGFAFLTVSKVGFIMSARAGTGVCLARTSSGAWSAPSAIGTAGAGFGFQAGAEMTEFIIILNSRAAVQSFMAAGSLTIGGNMTAAAGPLGRNLEGNASISTKGAMSAMYSYSRTKGLFGGASIEGSVIVERSDANAKAYGSNVTAAQLLSGQVDVPNFARGLIDAVTRVSGGINEWDDEETQAERAEARDREQRGYSFGTSFASGGVASPSPDSKKGILGFGSGGGRSRSGSAVSGGRGGPTAGSSYKFDQDFGDDYSRETESAARDRSNSGTSPRGKLRKGSASPGVKGFQFDEARDRSRSRGNSAGTSYGRNSGGVPHGGDYNFEEDDLGYAGGSTHTGNPRASFDSLDDDGDRENRYGHHADDDRYSAVSSSKAPKRKPFFSTSSFSKPSASPQSSSPFSDPSLNSSFDFKSSSAPRRPSVASKKSYQSKPWDSEDEDLMDFNGTNTGNRSRSATLTSTGTPRASAGLKNDPFDFSEVNVDFARNVIQNGGGGAERGSSRSRSRSGTTGGGLGTAIALFDFHSTTPGDLPFKKGDTITIIKQDDEEWWTGRLALKEGIVPRNYLEFHPGV